MTAPSVRPDTSRRRRTKARITTGAVTMRLAALRMLYWVPYCPVKLSSAEGAVCVAPDPRLLAKRNSFYVRMAVRIPAVTITGPSSGKMTEKRTRIVDAPSSRAASSIS